MYVASENLFSSIWIFLVSFVSFVEVLRFVRVNMFFPLRDLRASVVNYLRNLC
jgi:hypothetical protein